MDALDALAILLVLGVVLLLTRDRFAPDGLVGSIGAAFLPYRPDDGWPRGVQEEEPRPWAWSGPTRDAAATDDGALATPGEPEIIDVEAVGSARPLEPVSIERIGRVR
jgi:hypothetical protein